MTPNTRITTGHRTQDQPCPHCGDVNHVHWIESDAESDTWHCTSCHEEWTIPVTTPTHNNHR
jgi:predicted RNA-binding Zn-ribbon protein involved in translation (DUF1610 family)